MDQDMPEPLRQFIAESKWTFAKTYATTWPHEYIVESQVDGERFAALAKHIDTHGYQAHFYRTQQTYYDYDGLTYWHMGNIINRCPKSETYERRKAEGRLPKDCVRMFSVSDAARRS
jgi:hypothetical protein